MTTDTDEFAGKVAIVTAASRGIGRAMALRLAAGGARLVLTSTREETLEDVAQTIRGQGGTVICVATPNGETERVVDAALQAFGQIDILINIAGTARSAPFLTLTDEDWASGFGLKLFSAMRLCRAAWPSLKATSGSVLNMAGAYGRSPDASSALGSSVNAAVMAFTKSLSITGIEDGVQVNAINPGLIQTDRHRRRVEETAERWGLSMEDAEARLLQHHGISRVGTAEEVAELIAFVVSPKGKLFQGAIIDADGGFKKGI